VPRGSDSTRPSDFGADEHDPKVVQIEREQAARPGDPLAP